MQNTLFVKANCIIKQYNNTNIANNIDYEGRV